MGKSEAENKYTETVEQNIPYWESKRIAFCNETLKIPYVSRLKEL